MRPKFSAAIAPIAALCLLVSGRALVAQNYQPAAYHYSYQLAPETGGPPAAGSDSCQLGCATPDESMLASCLHGGQWYLGAEATFLGPVFRDKTVDPVSFTFQNIATGSTDHISSSTANSEYLTGAPRIWLGYQQNCGWGMLLRYWQMNTEGTYLDAYDPVGVPGDSLGVQANSAYDAYTLDLELTRDFYYRDWDMIGSFGLRHAGVDRSVTLSALGVAGATPIMATGLASQDFNGTGLTLGVGGDRPLGWGDLDVLWRARASTVWGVSSSAATAATSTPTVGGGSLVSFSSAADADDTLLIGEFQTGLMWSGDIKAFNARTFASIVFEYQFWDVGEGRAGGSATGLAPGIASGSVLSSAPDLHSHLIGFSIGTGFTW